ncbi:hypothetical protein C8Q79DRAFT_58384 [Trametes meyenii]|nr:hypothetical protein C8Q79DRAFT_58384 [Trametes meyenii]
MSAGPVLVLPRVFGGSAMEASRARHTVSSPTASVDHPAPSYLRERPPRESPPPPATHVRTNQPSQRSPQPNSTPPRDDPHDHRPSTRPRPIMYIRSETDGARPGAANCPTDYPSCAPTLSAGPALPNLPTEDASTSATTSILPLPPMGTGGGDASNAPAPTPIPQSALATSIQHIGKRNFVGIVVIAVLVFVGLVLWLSFGRWPRNRMRRVRERLKRGDKLPRSASGTPPSQEQEREQAQTQGDWRGGRAAAGFGDRRVNQDEQDEKPNARCAPEGGLYSPRAVEIEVDSLEKEAGEPRPKRVPRVHFA